MGKVEKAEACQGAGSEGWGMEAALVIIEIVYLL